jgi:hypothetical protein
MSEMRTPFFGTYDLLRRIFLMAFAFRRKVEESRQGARRRGMSAKNWWSLWRGSTFRSYRRARAVGPGTYSEMSPNQALAYKRRKMVGGPAHLIRPVQA